MLPIDPITKNYSSEMVDKFDKLIAPKGYDWKLRDILPKVLSAGENAYHLFAVARGLGAHTLHRQQVPVPLFRPVKAVVPAAFQGSVPGQGFAAERALPGGKRLRFHRCDPQWVRWHRRGRSYTLQSW